MASAKANIISVNSRNKKNCRLVGYRQYDDARSEWCDTSLILITRLWPPWCARDVGSLVPR